VFNGLQTWKPQKEQKGMPLSLNITCWSLGKTSDGLPSNVTNVDKKTPMNIGENTNCNYFRIHRTNLVQQHGCLVIKIMKINYKKIGVTWSTKRRKNAPDAPGNVTNLLKYKYLRKIKSRNEKLAGSHKNRGVFIYFFFWENSAWQDKHMHWRTDDAKTIW
jgi:hypothetical protein